MLPHELQPTKFACATPLGAADSKSMEEPIGMLVGIGCVCCGTGVYCGAGTDAPGRIGDSKSRPPIWASSGTANESRTLIAVIATKSEIRSIRQTVFSVLMRPPAFLGRTLSLTSLASCLGIGFTVSLVECLQFHHTQQSDTAGRTGCVGNTCFAG